MFSYILKSSFMYVKVNISCPTWQKLEGFGPETGFFCCLTNNDDRENPGFFHIPTLREWTLNKPGILPWERVANPPRGSCPRIDRWSMGKIKVQFGSPHTSIHIRIFKQAQNSSDKSQNITQTPSRFLKLSGSNIFLTSHDGDSYVVRRQQRELSGR